MLCKCNLEPQSKDRRNERCFERDRVPGMKSLGSEIRDTDGQCSVMGWADGRSL